MPSFSTLLAATFAFASFQLAHSQAAVASRPSCRCLPGDSCWPKSQEWAKLNNTVGGRLIATVPLAAPCHDPTYNAAECKKIKDLWDFPNMHEEDPSSIINPWQQNGSCDPFTPQTTPCTLGNYVDYSIKVSSWQDVAAGIQFAQKKNIRLVVKNTGHDYLGKSTGRGALGLWTHQLRSTQVIKQYRSSYYNGPALKVGAGVLGAEAQQAAQPAGLRVVGGSCPSVGIAGGYTQGAGHSTLSSLYGLGADQVLEWEVVTANGERVVATPTKNADLYFALSGGGPGTYGVVVSMTVRAHQDGPVGGALLSFTSQGISKDTYYKAIAAFQSQLPALVDSGATAIYIITAAGFNIAPITAPDKSAAEVTRMLDPYTKTLKSLNITYSINVTSESTFLGHFDKYFGPLPYGSYPTAQLLGGRLVPRSVVENNNDALTGVFRDIAENTPFYIAATALGVKKPKKSKPIADNAILPAWRDALLTVLVPSPWDFTVPRSVEEEREKQLTTSIIPKLTAVTPNSGTYMNEADFHLATWKQDFYGRNYGKLRAIKTKYDPGNLFYATTAVGSDAWKVADDGRMCRA
ncbi:MAG: hypothetical protein L6R40_004257 [Gallowayella cf. fulva]|nr:MAG: hypothetical protein L6R40_004257 [Xanthomendoza cf. fulva]